MRRAVLIAHDFAPRVGGRATGARTLAKGLSARGIEVRVYTATCFGPETSDLPAGTVRRLYPLDADPWSDLLLTLDALAADAPDVIHLCDAALGPWVPALRAAFPAVVTVEGHGEDLLAGEVDGARFMPGPGDVDLAARLGIAPDDEVVLAVSRLAQGKGHAAVLRALVELLPARPRALFVYTGDDPLLSSELAVLASDLSVRDRVRAAGLVDDADLPALYRLARVFVRLADEGSLDAGGGGAALLEAAASGLPVVASRAGSAPRVVEDRKTGLLVSPGDTRAAARALERLLADPAKARAMGGRGRARVLAGFGAGTRAGRIVDRWNALLSRGQEPGPQPLRGLPAAFTGGAAKAASARTIALREALCQVTSGAGLLRLARADASARRRAASRQRARFARIVGEGGLVRLRAVRSGAPLLPEALADCAELDHAPVVETSLRLFVTPDFQAHALPRIRGAILVHAVPAEGGRALLARLLSLPAGAFSRVKSLRLVLSPEARTSPRLALATLPEAQALLRLFAGRRVTATPPPELAPRLQATVAPRAGGVHRYEETLCSGHAPPAWVPGTLKQAMVDQARLVPGERPLVVDFGGDVAVALHGLSTIASRAGIEIDTLGMDPGDLAQDSWPVAEGTVALALSRAAVMDLPDKLAFVERVYRCLREGGVALIHVDQLRPGTRQLRRVRLPETSIDDLLAEQRCRGVEIHGQGNLVIAVRRTATPLVFPWKLTRAHPMEELIGHEEPGGTVSRYERCGPPPDGTYRNVTVEGRPVPVLRVKHGGTMVLVDPDGGKPRVWREQFKRRGSIAYGTFDLHRTNLKESQTFAESPVDRRGHWIIDGQGNVHAADGAPEELRGGERRV